ncbi:8-amino-7-oxononanoate synthase [Flavobacteriaceae bacterium UJ101]|nr:8-amino-7-oxononanoate synthase [Flavobacteriaceae bacterium UJ101]
MNLPKRLILKLEERKNNHVFRTVKPSNKNKKDFFSNDYLGYARNKRHFVSNGSSGSRLISGTHKEHIHVEKFLATFHKGESSLVFNSGYDANIGFFSCIPQKGDIVLYDELIHASIRDGMRLSLAKHYRFKHNDLEDLEKKIEQQEKNTIIYVVVESIYSMDGDSPDFKKLKELVQKYSIYLIVDEAHSLGLYGEKGAGLLALHNLEDDCFARLYTFGKALGRHGAVWVGSQDLTDYLTNFARSFMYTTALPSSLMQEIHEQYSTMEHDDKTREKLNQNILYYQKMIKKEKLEDSFSLNNTPIQSFFNENKSFLIQVSKELNEKGYNVKPIYAPTVPEGKERLRISLHSFNTFKEIDELIGCIKKLLKSDKK